MIDFQSYEDVEEQNPHMSVAQSSVVSDLADGAQQQFLQSTCTGIAADAAKQVLRDDNNAWVQDENTTNMVAAVGQVFNVYDSEIQSEQGAQWNTEAFNAICYENYEMDSTPILLTNISSYISVDPTQSDNEVHYDQSECVDMQSTPGNDHEHLWEVDEYQEDHFKYFHENEKMHHPEPHYMSRQSDINHFMRTSLVNWLAWVSEEFSLNTETLYLSVSYMDRFLSQISVLRNNLQLIGIASMYIASTYQEMCPPDVSDFIFFTNDSFSESQVLRMEQIILKILSFKLCTVTAYEFINMYAVKCSMPQKLKMLTLYICELTLLQADPFLRFYPSVISASAHALARLTLGYYIWTPALQANIGYSLANMKEVILFLSKLHNEAGTIKFQAIQNKYKAVKYEQVSIIKPLEEISSEQYDNLAHEYDILTNSEG